MKKYVPPGFGIFHRSMGQLRVELWLTCLQDFFLDMDNHDAMASHPENGGFSKSILVAWRVLVP